MAWKPNEKLSRRTAYPTAVDPCRVRLDANENPLDPHGFFAAEIVRAFREIPFNRYPDDTCTDLRQAFADLHRLPTESVVAGNGSDEMLGLLIGCALAEGETLLIGEPDFSMYQLYAEAYDRRTVRIAWPKGEKGDGKAASVGKTEALIAAVAEERPALMLFSNPASPFADVLSREAVRRVAEAADAVGTLVAVDEAYMDFCDQSVLAEVAVRPNLVVLRTLSKAWGLAGLRLGFLVAPPELAARLNAFRPPYNVNALAQAAGRVVLGHPEFLEQSVAEIKDRRERLYEKLLDFRRAPGIGRIWPSVTNFVCIETERDREIFEGLRRQSILVRRLPGMLRITVGSEEEQEQLLAVMEELLEGRAPKC